MPNILIFGRLIYSVYFVILEVIILSTTKYPVT